MRKYIIAGLLAALMTTGMVSSAAFASPSTRFQEFDTDQDGHLTTAELDARGCKLKRGVFEYLDEDKNGAIERRELVFNFSLVRHCK